MQVKFTTQGPMDFNNNRYAIVFNTSGNGMEPYAKDAAQLTYTNYSFAIIVGGSGGQVGAQVVQYVSQPGVGGGTVKIPQRLPVPPQDLILIPNSNGQNTQFTVQFARFIFNGILGAGATPSSAPPTTAPQSTWYINWFTLDSQNYPQDAPGLGGKNDTTFQFAINVNNVVSAQMWFNPAGAQQAPSPSLQLVSGQVDNNP